MYRDPRKDPTQLEFYEGLCRKTASMYEAFVEEEFDDLCQIFRLKAYRALGTFDASRSAMPVERYVFSCIRNQVKDVLKKERNVQRRDGRSELFIEDITSGGETTASDWFDAKYLSEREDQAFPLDAFDKPLIPSTLSHDEKSIVALLYVEWSQTEIALRLGLTKREVALGVKAIREKFEDWRPSNSRQPNVAGAARRSSGRGRGLAEPPAAIPLASLPVGLASVGGVAVVVGVGSVD